MLSNPSTKIVRMADVKFAAVDVKHVSPEGQRQSFDKLKTVGFW